MEEPAGQISPYAYLLSAAFMIWMLVDAWRRRMPFHWYFIIVVMPFGAIFYFVMVKLRGPREQPHASPNAQPGARPSMPFSFGTIPPALSLDHADTLESSEQYAEAEPIYRTALAADSANKQALHGLGRCLIGSGRAAESLAYFEQLLELDREYRNFGAALDYADALWAANQQHDTIELLERLAEVTDRINHRLALAHYLAELGQVERAKTEIERALAKATGPGAPFNERQRQWVDRGQQMLTELSERLSDDSSNIH